MRHTSKRKTRRTIGIRGQLLWFLCFICLLLLLLFWFLSTRCSARDIRRSTEPNRGSPARFRRSGPPGDISYNSHSATRPVRSTHSV